MGLSYPTSSQICLVSVYHHFDFHDEENFSGSQFTLYIILYCSQLCFYDEAIIFSHFLSHLFSFFKSQEYLQVVLSNLINSLFVII